MPYGIVLVRVRVHAPTKLAAVAQPRAKQASNFNVNSARPAYAAGVEEGAPGTGEASFFEGLYSRGQGVGTGTVVGGVVSITLLGKRAVVTPSS